VNIYVLAVTKEYVHAYTHACMWVFLSYITVSGWQSLHTVLSAWCSVHGL